MKEIIEINKRIMIEAPEAVPEGDCFFLARDGKSNGTDKLPPAIKAYLDELCAKLDVVVPNDFNYVLCLGD